MIVGLSVVHNEEDVIGTVIAHTLAEGVDRIVVADNLSTDRTREILDGFDDRVTVVDDPEFGHYHGDKISRLARQAYEDGAEWIVPFDADEVWYGVDPQTGEPCRIADALAQVEDGFTVVQAPGWDHLVSDLGQWHTSPAVDTWETFSPFRRQHTQQLAKIAFRADPDVVVAMGNHNVRLPVTNPIQGPLAYRHFQYRSLEQMTRKLRRGREVMVATDLHPMECTHWRAGGLKSDAELADAWAELCSEDGLVFDPAPLRVEVGA